jgi:phosphopantothenoylcysteine decarboxylase/phosphopantothenate--cysteine ligase
MNILITCGPSYEPIDEVRRITNFSTGRLGITLANHFTDAGHHVTCLKGEQATDPTPLRAQKTIPFTTNDDLAQKLQQLTSEKIDAIFHAAALADFKVASVQNPAGQKITSTKFSTRGENLTLTLAPTTKILPQLRRWFPNAKIVGWKYELTGTREEAIAKAHQQVTEAATNACVLNGAAYGPGYLFCTPDASIALPTLNELTAYLLLWTQRLKLHS